MQPDSGKSTTASDRSPAAYDALVSTQQARIADLEALNKKLTEDNQELQRLLKFKDDALAQAHAKADEQDHNL